MARTTTTQSQAKRDNLPDISVAVCLRITPYEREGRAQHQSSTAEMHSDLDALAREFDKVPKTNLMGKL